MLSGLNPMGRPLRSGSLLASLRCILLLVVCSITFLSVQSESLGPRSLQPLSSEDISRLLTMQDPVKNVDPSNPQSHLSKILIPRAAGTENNTLVREYIVSRLKALNWHIDLDDFVGETPVGAKRFVNIIATKDKDASRRVVLSAHYDSKYYPNYPENQFVGATDSAAPCAMMLDLAETLNPLLEAKNKSLDDGSDDDDEIGDTTLQFVFFDGEEAFIDWTDTDSIYGARHLAEKWGTTYLPPSNTVRMHLTELDTIEHLILLDLLGAPNPLIRSFFINTAWLFDSLVSVEKRLGESGAFAYGDDASMAAGKWSSYFRPRMTASVNYDYMGDDHVPFLKRGVSVLHLIAEPFPHVWHTLKDDASALDIPTMRRWNLMLRVFMSEYLNLKPSAHAGRAESVLHRSESELVSVVPTYELRL